MTEAETLNHKGGQLLLEQKYEDAVVILRQAIALDPTFPPARTNLGCALDGLARFDEALVELEAALDLEPNAAIFNVNYAQTLTQVARFEEAIDFCHHAIMLRPDMPAAFHNMGNGFWGLNLFDQAIAAWRTALALDPGLSGTRKNRGIVLLSLERFTEGFSEYNSRFLADQAQGRPFGDKVFDLRPIVGGSAIVWSEQGLGDEILQASMIPDVRKYIDRLWWECDARLASLLQRSFPGVDILARVDKPEMPDVGEKFMGHIPAYSVAALARPTKHAFPKTPKYLVADLARVDEMHERLHELKVDPNQRLVGISWRSESKRIGHHKTTKLADWLALLTRSGYQFVDLQYGDTADERAAYPWLAHIPGLNLKDDVEGLAALISMCDRVVTVSNTTAHLAGALGVPTLVLVSSSGGKLWYWGTDRVTTPLWYPSVEIVRQGAKESWAAVLARVAAREDV